MYLLCFDWFTVFSVSFVIGWSEYFSFGFSSLYRTRLQGIMVVEFTVQVQDDGWLEKGLKVAVQRTQGWHYNCFINSRRNGEELYFPAKASIEREVGKHIERENFTLTRHRVCSAHFEGGKKSYVNIVATVFSRYNSRVSPEARSFRMTIVRPHSPPFGLDGLDEYN